MTTFEFTCADCDQRKKPRRWLCGRTGYAVRDNRDKVLRMLRHRWIGKLHDRARTQYCSIWLKMPTSNMGLQTGPYCAFASALCARAITTAGCRYDVWFVDRTAKRGMACSMATIPKSATSKAHESGLSLSKRKEEWGNSWTFSGMSC